MTLRAETPPLSIGMTLIGVMVALVVWQAIAQLTTGMFLFAGPVAVVGHLLENGWLLSRAALTTLSSATAGFLIGTVTAIALGTVSISFPRVERLVSGVALVIFCLPFIATGPILRVVYGVGDGPQITLAALASYYTSYLCLMVGLRAVPSNWLDLVRSHGRGRFAELLHVRAPASIPYLTAGLQIGAPAAFLGAMVGEFTGAERGLGVLSIRAMRALDVDMTWAIAIIATTISSLAFWFFGWLGKRLGAAPAPVLIVPRRDQDESSSALRLLASAGRLGAIIAFTLLAWLGLMEAFGLSTFFAKRPQDVWAYLVSGAEAGANRATLFLAYGQTLSLTIPGYLLGLVLGIGLAIALVMRPGLATTALPVAIALRAIPIVTTAPLLVLVLGRGPVGTIVIVAVMTFFPTLTACLEGLRRAPRPVLDLLDSYAAGPWQRLIHAQLPAMAPAAFASARMAIPAALLAATTAEWLATGTGMGRLMALTASTSDYGMLWSAIVLLAATASAAYAVAEIIERRILKVVASEQVAL